MVRTSSELDNDVDGFVTHLRKHFSFMVWIEDFLRQAILLRWNGITDIDEVLSHYKCSFTPHLLYDLLFSFLHL